MASGEPPVQGTTLPVDVALNAADRYAPDLARKSRVLGVEGVELVARSALILAAEVRRLRQMVEAAHAS